MTSTNHPPTPPERGRDDRRPEPPAPAAPPPSPPPARGPSARLLLLVFVVAVVALWIGSIWGAGLRRGLSSAWTMVANVTSRDDAAASDEEDDTRFYTCGMHPWVILPKPGLCPICHMDLTPLDPDKFTGEITIDPVITQNIGVRIDPVIAGPLVKTIRTVGTVDYDERSVRDVNVKVTGWIERLHVDYVGAEVQAGEPLFDFYSPDLYVAQEAFLRALRDRRRLAADADPAAIAAAQGLVDSARVQLEYYDVTEDQIDDLAARGTATKTLTIRSPHQGVVIAKHANEGMRVDQGMQVYRIADLDKVWVMVTLYEYQLPYVQEGQAAVMTLPYIPGQPFRGEVIYVYPYLDRNTRQASVRLEFDNPHGLLKPGMYANIELRNTLAARRTLAPRSAVIDTGERQVAFVSLGEGRFEPREVRLGVETDAGLVEVLDGLRPGEMVVTSGQFLLDSEARIREGLAKMIRGTLASEQDAVVASAGSSELSSLPEPAQAALSRVLDAYFAIGDTLAGDAATDLAPPARAIAAGVDELLAIPIPEDEHFWHRHDEVATVRGKALELIDATGIEPVRLIFADLSISLSKLTRATGIPIGYRAEVHELHCPMYREGQGGSIWLQPKGSVRNPFYGSMMLECFDERAVLPRTGSRPEPPPADTMAPPPPDPPPSGAATTAHEREMQAILDAYAQLSDLLIRDEFDGAAAHLKTIGRVGAELASEADERVRSPAARLEAAGDMAATDLESARAAYEAVSMALLELAPVAPPDASATPVLYHVYCPMVKKSWLQTVREVSNPYAPYMLRCGRVERTVASRAAEEAGR